MSKKLYKKDLFDLIYSSGYNKLLDKYGSFLKTSKNKKLQKKHDGTIVLFNIKKMREVLKKEGII